MTYDCQNEKANSTSAYRIVLGKCYYIQIRGCPLPTGDGCTYKEAENLCKTIFGPTVGGKIFEPTTLKINNEVLKVAKNLFGEWNYWIGVKSGNNKYKSNGKPVLFDAWTSGFPYHPNDPKYCTRAYSGTWKWHDYRSCSYTDGYTICETSL